MIGFQLSTCMHTGYTLYHTTGGGLHHDNGIIGSLITSDWSAVTGPHESYSFPPGFITLHACDADCQGTTCCHFSFSEL